MNKRAAEVHRKTRETQIVVTLDLDGQHDRLRDCLRVTVGTPDENDLLLEALSAAISP